MVLLFFMNIIESGLDLCFVFVLRVGFIGVLERWVDVEGKG